MTRAVVSAAAAALSATALAVPLGESATRATIPCSPQVRNDVLPVWMRAGFRGPPPRMHYAIGRDGAIGAILFGAPLNAPPARDKNNKILWVSRTVAKGLGALWIRMQRMDGATTVGAPVTRVLSNGPGPSIVDAPGAGCWRFTLTWSGRHDTLDLAYVPPHPR